MKAPKLLTAILIVLLCNTPAAIAQTALYKSYINHKGITPSCIEQLPVGEGLSATVTMLEANDSASFRSLMSQLKALPYHKKKGGNWPLGMIESANVDVTLVDDGSAHPATHSPVSLCFFCRDPLPGDNGQYLIYNSTDLMTVVVFHCPDNDVYAQVVRYVLQKTVEKAKSE